jgi:hypothetical protein
MPAWVSSFPLVVEQRLAWLARRKWLSIFLIGALSLASRALLLPILPIPRPAIQDEFSYLLASDTFASGRLANPTPAFPEHFETPQVIVHPTYASKYPPLSGLALAFGQNLTGEPWVGVWLSAGILCGAICWALQGWLPASWALLGAFLALLRIGIVTYWSEGYWGGACAATGGALVIGALPRLLRRHGAGAALAFASGIAILANTRPYEGLVLVLASAVYLAVILVRRKTGIGHWVRNVALPMALVLVPVLAWMGYYNYRVTGNPWELPYAAHEKQYAVWSPLLWQTHPAPEPVYSNGFLKEFWAVGDSHEKLMARQNLVKAHVSDAFDLGRFFLGWPLILAMLGLALPLWRDPRARGVLLLLALFYAGVAFDDRLVPHYAAPGAALVYILAACAFRGLRKSWPGGFAERMYLPWCLFAVFTITTLAGLLNARYRFGPVDFHVLAKRSAVMKRLQKEPGRQLVLVRYGARHDLYEELVYNSADIERSQVIWARSLDPARDRQLLDHYRDRHVWLLEEDGKFILTRYAGAIQEDRVVSGLRTP